MALSIKDPRADELAREVARLAGESLTEAVARALEERLERLKRDRPGRRRLAGELDEIARRCAALAAHRDLPLLFKGDDFGRTDIDAAA